MAHQGAGTGVSAEMRYPGGSCESGCVAARVLLCCFVLLSGSKLNESDYPTCRIPSEQLHLTLDILWDSLEPESEKILGNVALLPSITNPAALPYCDIDENESLLVKDIPGFLLPQKKYSGKDVLPCLLCGELTVLKDI